jgi:60 kDa SS-A/Ro ribonucleoprotein
MGSNDPLRDVGTRATPQSEQIPGRTDQVLNRAGGYVFGVDDWTHLRRFLVLGTQGGTYYAGQADLTKESADIVMKLAREDGVRLVNELLKVSLENLAPKVNPTIFALAVAASAGEVDDKGVFKRPQDLATRHAALQAIPQICRTGTHLYTFVQYLEQFRGWSTGMTRAVARWFEERPVTRPEQPVDLPTERDSRSPLDLQAIKYRQRGGWSHRDVLRLSHPDSTDPVRKTVFDWICEPARANRELLPELIKAHEAAMASTDAAEVARLVTEHRLPWEALPDFALREPKVWEALLPHTGYTALIRNLGRLSNIKLLTSLSDAAKTVIMRLSDPEAIRRARVHPFAVLLALATYKEGGGFRGKMTWEPVASVVDALDKAFYDAFGNVEPTGKNLMLALDVSGSMGSPVLDSPLSCREAAAAMALITLNVEPNTIVTAFSANDPNYRWQYGYRNERQPISEIALSPRMRLDTVVQELRRMDFGGTDVALPMIYAIERDLSIDAFLVYTDNESWAGQIHPTQALRAYRERSGRAARLVSTAFATTHYSVADPSDGGQMDVVGFDASAPQVISDFVAGRL